MNTSINISKSKKNSNKHKMSMKNTLIISLSGQNVQNYDTVYFIPYRTASYIHNKQGTIHLSIIVSLLIHRNNRLSFYNSIVVK